MSVLHPKLEALQRTLLTPSALTQVNDPWLAQRRIELWLKRDDLRELELNLEGLLQ